MRTAGNADLIKEIQGGIKKEGSVGCAIGARTCSICGSDILSSQCRHVPGKSYKGQMCYAVLSDAVDAYEFSLVAIPAQRNAGISKNFDDNQHDETLIRVRLAGMQAKFGGDFDNEYQSNEKYGSHYKRYSTVRRKTSRTALCRLHCKQTGNFQTRHCGLYIRWVQESAMIQKNGSQFQA